MRYIKTVKELSLKVRRLPMTLEDQRLYNYNIGNPSTAHKAVVALARTHLRDLDQEYFITIPLDSKNRPLGAGLGAAGGPDVCNVDMRSVFRMAIHLAATSLVIAHNHPSGDRNPSPDDLRLTRAIAHAADILDLILIDHLIVTPDGGYLSLRKLDESLFHLPIDLDRV